MYAILLNPCFFFVDTGLFVLSVSWFSLILLVERPLYVYNIIS